MFVQGTVHLAGFPPRVKTLCRKLGVDFAEALVGFERRGGTTIPTFDGVVVCAEHAEAVHAAFLAEEQCAAPLGLLQCAAFGCRSIAAAVPALPHS